MEDCFSLSFDYLAADLGVAGGMFLVGAFCFCLALGVWGSLSSSSVLFLVFLEAGTSTVSQRHRRRTRTTKTLFLISKLYIKYIGFDPPYKFTSASPWPKAHYLAPHLHICLSQGSYSEFGVVGLEVEFLAGRGECSWHFFVDFVDVVFEVALALVGSEVEGEGAPVADYLPVLLAVPLAVLLVHEVPVPGLVPEDSEVLEELEGVEFGDD